jgi:hypothetical protein
MIGKRIAVLVSGRGTNLAALLGAMRCGALGGTITRIISSNPDAHTRGGTNARRSAHRPRSPRCRRATHSTALAEAIDGEQPGLVVMAGFMRVLGAPLVRRCNRLINVHPSLLPSYPAFTRTDGRWPTARAYGCGHFGAGGRRRPDHRAGGGSGADDDDGRARRACWRRNMSCCPPRRAGSAKAGWSSRARGYALMECRKSWNPPRYACRRLRIEDRTSREAERSTLFNH